MTRGNDCKIINKKYSIIYNIVQFRVNKNCEGATRYRKTV